MAEHRPSAGIGRWNWRRARLMLPLLLALGALLVTSLGGCGGPASTIFTSAAPTDAIVPYITASNFVLNASVVGLRGKDGTEAWRTAIGLRDNDQATATAGGALYVQGMEPGTPSAQPSSTFILALRLADGTTLWRVPLPSTAEGPDIVATASAVIVTDVKAGLYALDPADGAIRWHVPGSVVGPAQLVGDVVVVSVGADQPPNDPSGIAAYRLSDGALLWQQTYTTSFVTNKLGAYTSTLGDDTVALAAQDGHALWSYQSGATANGGFPHPSQVIGAGDQVVLVQVSFPVTSDSAPTKDYVAALDAHTGSVKWQFSPGFDELPPRGSPRFITGGDATTIVGVHASQVIALRASDGTKLWQSSLSPYSAVQLTAVDDVLFALLSPPNCELGPCSGPRNQRLEAFNAATGATYWQRDLPDAVALASP